MTEVGVVHSDQPVGGIILLVILGIEVEAVEVAVIRDRAVAGDDLGIVGLPVVDDVIAQGSGVHFAAQSHDGGQGGRLRVVEALDAVDVHVVGVPVVHVLDVHMGHLGLVLLQDERAVVVHLVSRSAELSAQLLQLRAVGGHEAAIGQAGEEVGGDGLEGVLQGVGIHGLDANLGEIGDFAIVVLRGIEDVGSAGHHISHVGLIDGIQHILKRSHKVSSGHISHGVAVVVVPLLAFAELEGPGQLVGGAFPGLSQAGDQLADVVVLHQSIDDVGANGLIPGGAGGQVVEGRDFAAIKGRVDRFLRHSGHAGQQQAQGQNESKHLLHAGNLLIFIASFSGTGETG